MCEVDKEKFNKFLALHEPQLLSSGVPKHLFPSLFAKVTNETFDAGEYFMCIQEEGETGITWTVQVNTEDGIKYHDPNAIFLVDHAWTFRWNNAREQLENNPKLLERMMNIALCCDVAEEEKNIQNTTAELLKKPSIVLLNHNSYDPIDKVLKSLWIYANTYSVRDPNGDTESTMPVWYIMDEFGCRVGHDNNPNVRMVPFLHISTGVCYSLLFPIKDLQHCDSVHRHYAENCVGELADLVDYHLLPWIPHDYSQFIDQHPNVTQHFLNSYRRPDEMPDLTNAANGVETRGVKELRIYSDSRQLVEYLKSDTIVNVDSPDNANVWWITKHFKDYRTLASDCVNTMINQFPSESCLTVKDLLAVTVQSVYRKGELVQYPNWFKRTYNLQTELPQFVAHFQKREKIGEDNTWIIKPWNLARGLDTYVTNDLTHIIRLVQSGPKIACKYIEHPVLFYREDMTVSVKFDLRYIIFVRSIKPLEVYVYDKFWIRFAKKGFCLDYFDDYERHFTVFNYSDPAGILQMECSDFICKFEEQNKGCNWKRDIEPMINKALKDLMIAVTTVESPRGLAHNPQSRAMYGIDVMLEYNHNTQGAPKMEPVILEANFMPDCQRACEYYPDFADTVFSTLFKSDVPNENNVTKL